MAQLQTAFNSQTNNQKMDDYSVIPGGKYICSITKSEYVKTKAGTGTYLKITLKILEGNFKGKVIFEQLNLVNPSEVAVEIANKVLNTICAACNKANVQDSIELHGIPMEVAIKLKPATQSDAESNEITMYYPHNSAQNLQQPVQNQVQQPVQNQVQQQQQQPIQNQVQQPINTAATNPPVADQNQVQQPVQNQGPPVQQQTQQQPIQQQVQQQAPPAADTKPKLPWE
jgi:hypothetical protein